MNCLTPQATTRNLTAGISLLLLWGGLCSQLFAQAPSDSNAEQLEFFESRIRPVLVERCYACHNSAETAEADLAVDSRKGIRSRTEHGPVVVPGKPAQSLLLKVIRHEVEGLEMPEDDAKLDDSVVADFEKWISSGAYDPRDQPPTAEDLAVATSWQAKLEKRKQWWSLQPIRRYPVPAHSAAHPIDRFIGVKLQEQNLKPAPIADSTARLRRLTFVITGLPPTPKQMRQFAAINSDADYERFVDELLASEAYGERWARHFMDLVRYTDSHGSEGDPTIPHAYRYRDYLIRALNADVPYNQLVREHVAGDLIQQPRINESLGINESAIGTAHWRMVFHGFAPTDAMEEKVRFVDDQINVFSKAFLGLTVSCARCHDHKFDAISQADYYALFGILASCRPALVDANLPNVQHRHELPLRELKRKIRRQASAHWLGNLTSLRDEVATSIENPNADWTSRIKDAKDDARLLNLWHRLDQIKSTGKSFSEAWAVIANDWRTAEAAEREDRGLESRVHYDFANAEDYASWFADGNGLPNQPIEAGDFIVAPDGDGVIKQVLPASVHTASVSTRQRGFLTSPRLELDDEYRVYFRVAGEGNPSARYSVQHYPRNGTVYPIRSFNHRDWRFLEYDLKYWRDDSVHFELATARDAPVQVRGDARSWFGVREVIVRRQSDPKPVRNPRPFLAKLLSAASNAPSSGPQFAGFFVDTLRDAIIAWRDENATDDQSLLIDRCLAEGLLSNNATQLGVEDLIDQYRSLEGEIPEPYRVPGLAESVGWDHPLFERGDHRRPSEVVSRRFLEAIDATPIGSTQSGRLELAAKVTSPNNPLTPRVFANRLWHYVFGEGLVRTPDNFGRLGDTPVHPELLDYLASRFIEDGWSMKRAIKFMVTSQTWQASSVPTANAVIQDPSNRWWSHALVRRLEAEAIRDSLLAVTGKLSDAQYGPTVPANRFSDRRSVYLAVRRNSLDQFLHAFDAPVPFSTKGRRDATNVPAQSLTLLNDPFVRGLAKDWANELREEIHAGQDTDVALESFIETVFVDALSRKPTQESTKLLKRYLRQLDRDAVRARQTLAELRERESRLASQQIALIEPIRAQIKRDQKANATASSVEPPLVEWRFSEGLKDRVQGIEGRLVADAKQQSDAIVLRDNGYFASSPIEHSLKSKTLVASVRLERLQQRGGGVVSVQTTNGVVFDAIVFGERQPNRWIAGSNSFARTEDLDGPAEEAAGGWLHLAAVYESDGTIRFFRNGKPYGRETRKAGLQEFRSGDWQVLVGLRHGNTGRLAGDVSAAAVYDRALTGDEIASLALGADYVSTKDVLERMSRSQRDEYERNQAELSVVRDSLAKQEADPEALDSWARFIHVVFNLKEFIYLN